VELSEIMRTQHACRYFRPDPLPDDVLYRAIEMARFAPNGGNRNAVRFVIVRNPDKRRALGEIYQRLWLDITAALAAGENAIRTPSGVERPLWGRNSNPTKSRADADHFATHFGEHPAVIVVCIDIAQTHATDSELGRRSIVGGASVYPMAQNLCLALRSEGVATTFTTLMVQSEPQVKEILGIPEQFSTACHIVAGYPAQPFPRKLLRASVEEIAFVDTFGESLRIAQPSAA
jgi:nitroreductase